jgi:hypothetical protein
MATARIIVDDDIDLRLPVCWSLAVAARAHPVGCVVIVVNNRVRLADVDGRDFPAAAAH